jgi:hypothetical protein
VDDPLLQIAVCVGPQRVCSSVIAFSTLLLNSGAQGAAMYEQNSSKLRVWKSCWPAMKITFPAASLTTRPTWARISPSPGTVTTLTLPSVAVVPSAASKTTI